MGVNVTPVKDQNQIVITIVDDETGEELSMIVVPEINLKEASEDEIEALITRLEEVYGNRNGDT